MKQLIWLATFVFAFTLGQPSFADCDKNQKDCKMHQRMDRLADKLGLTAEQKAKVKAFKAQNRAAMKADRAQLRALRGQISQLVQADKIDEGKLDGLVSQVNKIRGDMLRNRIMMQHKMYSILTEEQRAKYKALKMKWENKHH